MMFAAALPLCCLALLAAPETPPLGAKAVVAVFAHPDDETSVGPLLAKWALQEVPVHVVVLTSGQQGTAHTDIPAGEKLGREREAEMRKACEAYGIAPPLLLGEEDGKLPLLPPERQEAIMRQIAALVAEKQADVLPSFGPDGFTGHPDHKATANLAEELWLRWEQLAPEEATRPQLYQTALPKSVWEKLPKDFHALVPVDDSVVDTVIEAPEGIEATLLAIARHKSQFQPEQQEAMAPLFRDVFAGRVYLRRVGS